MDCKGKDVLSQIRKQKPDPQPEVNLSGLDKLERQRKEEKTVVWDTNNSSHFEQAKFPNLEYKRQSFKFKGS